MADLPIAVPTLGTRLEALGWVRDLWVAGSLATGDHVPGVSDLDLVAVVVGPMDATRRTIVSDLHADLDRRVAAGAALGCVYVEETRLQVLEALHPTWTHGRLVDRILSGITRVELAQHGVAVTGRHPASLLPAVSRADVSGAARAELDGYWSWAARRPHLFLSSGMPDLGLTSMARGRHAVRHGVLMSKTDAIEHLRAPRWLVEQVRARRSGHDVSSPRVIAGWIAWQDVRRTVREARLSRRGPRA